MTEWILKGAVAVVVVGMGFLAVSGIAEEVQRRRLVWLEIPESRNDAPKGIKTYYMELNRGSCVLVVATKGTASPKPTLSCW